MDWGDLLLPGLTRRRAATSQIPDLLDIHSIELQVHVDVVIFCVLTPILLRAGIRHCGVQHLCQFCLVYHTVTVKIKYGEEKLNLLFLGTLRSDIEPSQKLFEVNLLPMSLVKLVEQSFTPQPRQRKKLEKGYLIDSITF
jgi:hypothetical protein